MAAIRKHKGTSNYYLTDNNLSLKAKGLLSLMLSLPEDSVFTVNELTPHCRDGKSAIQSALKELVDYCYLRRNKTRDRLGHYVYTWDIYEDPYHNADL